MDIEVFALCDATTDQMGKLNLLGAFDVIYSESFPLLYHKCAVALRIRFAKIEQGHHKLRLNFVDEDGKNVLPPLDGNIDVKIEDKWQSSAKNLILNINNITFKNAGTYSIDLAIDGRQERSLPLFLIQQKRSKGNR